MAQTSPMSPTTIFDRIESLKRWQMEQQQRLIKQQSEQSKFLSTEHKRMYEALGIQQNADKENHSRGRNQQFSNCDQTEYTDSGEEIDDESINPKEVKYIDDIPIKSPVKDFNILIEEKLKTDTPVLNEYSKPRRKFLKKGAGLTRFRMTVDDLAHKKPKPILPPKRKQSLPQNKQKPVEAPKVIQKSSKPISKPTQAQNVKSTQPVKPKQVEPKIQIEAENNFPSYDMEPLVLNSENLSLRKSVNNIVFPRRSIDFNSTESINEIETPKSKYSEPKVTWSNIPEQRAFPEGKSNDYEALLAELIEVRQQNPALFDTPVINQSSHNEQQIFENELSDELKLFEILEQKASNSSFCSTSSIVTKLMEHPVRSTPKKQLNFSLLTSGIPEEDSVVEVKKLVSPPRRAVSFANQAKKYEPSVVEETEDETIVSDSDSESSSSDSNSSINSEDICTVSTIVPTKYKNQNPVTESRRESINIFKDAATNTDQPIVNSELLKTRLTQLETELDTFRSENARVTKLKSQLELEARNYEKRKRQLEKDIEEQKKQIKIHLEEERAKLAKDKAVYNRYVHEIRDGKSARQKEREELIALRSRVTSLEEEMKLKESKWGATQARIRSQLKHIEKDNAALRTENTELRTKNGKLEATNKQLLSRRPSDTKVLHEINKNLTKLTQEAKEKVETKEKRKSLDKNKKKTPIKNTTRDSIPPKTYPEDNKENKRHSLNSTDDSRSSTERSFESVEREYEKLFGKSSLYENEEHAKLPLAEASSCSDTSGRREETVLEDGSMKITYPNGNVRNISADGQMIVMHYHNGDIKETCKETGTIRYLYADAKTWHTTYPDGMELLEFANGQIEKRLIDGSSEILFPNGCRRYTSADGKEEVSFPDGTLLLTRSCTGERILTLPNGQREIHTRDHKRREYPDGTVKLLYPDGVQETRYANGRIRLKDKQGNLIMDSAAV